MLLWHQSKGWSGVCLLATSQTLNGSFFIHPVSKAKLCVYLPDLLAWGSLTNGSSNTEAMWSLVIDRATAMRHLPKMLFWSLLKTKRKGVQGIFGSGVQLFWEHTLVGTVKDHSSALEENSTSVCRWNKTVAYLKSRKWRWNFSLVSMALQWNLWFFLEWNVNQSSQAFPDVFLLQIQQQAEDTWMTATTQNTHPFLFNLQMIRVTWQRERNCVFCMTTSTHILAEFVQKLKANRTTCLFHVYSLEC